MTTAETSKYVIIGNSAGAIGAAEAIRSVDEKGTLLIVSDEPYPAYSRPLIAEHLYKGSSIDRMSYRPADFYEKNNIRTILGRKATALDGTAHTVTLDDGTVIGWEKLLLATGGTPIIPPMPGVDLNGVFNFITLDDAKGISAYIKEGMKAVVIGGGLIGISVTEALTKRGVTVSIVEMKDKVLNVMLDSETSDLEEAALKEAGVGILTGHTVSRINPDYRRRDAVGGVTLDDGQEIVCDLVVVAIGVRPRTDLAKAADIEVNRGILVDSHMATSNPDVYACGDAAEAYDYVIDARRPTPIWPNAYVGGRTAGFNMAGKVHDYPGGTSMNSLKYFGQDIVSAGLVTAPDDSYEVISRRNGHEMRKVILKDNIPVGMVFTGNIDKSGVVFGLIRDRINVGEFKEDLVAADFSLASLPEAIKQARLGTTPATATAPVEEAPETDVVDE